MKLREKQRKVPEGLAPGGFVAVQLPPAASPAAPLPASQVDGGGSQEDEGSVAGSGASSTGSSSAAPAALEISHVCATCRRLKIACEGEFPCQRCFRLSLPCRPQLPRARKGPKRRMTPEEEEREERDRERLNEAAKALPMVDLCLQRSNPQMHTQTYLQVFHQYYDEGLVCRLKTINVLRHWHWLSEVAGSDVSLGMGAVIARKLDIGALDLECEDSLVLDPGAGSEAARRERRLAVEREARARAEALKAQPLFRLEDSGGEDCVHMLIVDRVLVQATNEGFERVFRGALELTGDVMRKRALLALLFASLAEKDDRPLWFRCVISTMFCRIGTSSSEFIRVFTRSGDVTLYLLQSKSLRVDLELDSEGGGEKYTHVVKLVRAPNTRYVTDRPDHMQLARTFSSRTASSSSSSAPPPPPEGVYGPSHASASGASAAAEDAMASEQAAEGSTAAQRKWKRQEPEACRFPYLVAALPFDSLTTAQTTSLLSNAPQLAPDIIMTGPAQVPVVGGAPGLSPKAAPSLSPTGGGDWADWHVSAPTAEHEGAVVVVQEGGEGGGGQAPPYGFAPSGSLRCPSMELLSFEDDGDPRRAAWLHTWPASDAGQVEEGEVPCLDEGVMANVFEASLSTGMDTD